MSVKDLCYTFGEIAAEPFWGWYIVSASYKKSENTEKKCVIIRKTKRIAEIISQDFNEALTVKLVAPTFRAGWEKCLNMDSSCDFWRTFSHEEIYGFIKTTGDSNPVHSGENPIVPGLLIISDLPMEDCLRADFKFFQPIRAGEKIALAYRNNGESDYTVYGVVNGIKCFKVEYLHEIREEVQS